jgi:hypothetical protein
MFSIDMNALFNSRNREEVYLERVHDAEPVMSGSGDVNLIRMIEDHAPARIGALQKEIEGHRLKAEKLEEEVILLKKLLNVATRE